ncbi:cupin 2 conserved barrel domain protein [Acaromyces ingoldii]|uniref:Cupin 2 conserved barrel domain protein n=1 Tax=Acaromyces ingoldii TaxID=215250 RepID=A0A316YGX2_9BASI|nr:cupin 2 conserved barrel domain protein [Acaromyces ingoldii]PWN88790.1 cupin 2 conserved barrel domain protein [Acaromyces ingoldii]
MNPLRRIVTGHAPDGRSVILVDDNPRAVFLPGSDTPFQTVFHTEDVPVSIEEPVDVGKSDLLPTFASAGGLVFRSVDLSPASESPEHRTDTLDLGVVVHGQVELHVEASEPVLLKTGDTYVQRATMHKWANPSQDQWARIVYLTVQAQTPVIAGGKALEDHMQSHFHLSPAE